MGFYAPVGIISFHFIESNPFALRIDTNSRSMQLNSKCRRNGYMSGFVVGCGKN